MAAVAEEEVEEAEEVEEVLTGEEVVEVEGEEELILKHPGIILGKGGKICGK